MELQRLLTLDLPEQCPDEYAIARLAGDASTRSYFRIRIPSGENIVLMKMPEAFETTSFAYLHNYDLFRSLGVELAEIYAMEPSRGYVFLQDLGDFTFHELYQQWDEAARARYYLRAIDAIFQIQKGSAVAGLSFDAEKFSWELNYFKKYFLLGLRGVSLSETETELLASESARLAQEIADRPRALCHRDYHSRNLMVCDDRLYIVDFQDARYGPVTYDLASLCYDSYLQHPAKFLSHMENYFFTHYPDASIQRYEYPRVCLQRNLKALGTFGYQATQMDRMFYVQFVEPTLSYIKRHFEKLPEYANLQQLLARHLPELR